MKLWSDFTKVVSVSALLAVSVVAPALNARAAGPAIDADARTVLAATSSYLANLKNFSVDYSTVDEVVTAEGQKLQFLHSGEIIVERPDKLYATRNGAAGAAEVFLDGKTLTLFSKAANVYVKLAASNIDQAIAAVHKLGFDAPGADLLATNPLNVSTTDITSGAHVGMTYIDGIEVHQLAFRGAGVDWQLWVMAGDKPLPLRYVITTKSLSGAPQYTLQLKNWNTTPQTSAARFAFTPPSGAKQLAPAAVTANAIGDLTIKGK
jgi:hypothetical protein